jgi:hypothetical protein
MDTQKLLNAPPKQPKIIAKISKINNLVEVSTSARKSSTKLRKIFENGNYQKRTQLSVLNRYKKKLDSINGESDKRLEKSRKQTGKSIVPKIKPFVGTLFTPKSDPLKAIGQLAAFNVAHNLAKGNILGTVGPGLALASIIFGPKLLKFGTRNALKVVGVGKGYEDLIKKLSKSKNLTAGEEVALKNFDRYRKAGLGVEESAQRALTRGSGYSIGTAKEYGRLTRTVEGVGERTAERAAARGTGEVAGGALKGIGRFAGPVLDVAFAGFDFYSRKQEGQTNVQAGLGAAGGAIGGYAGWEAGAALGASIGAAFGGVGALPGALIGGLVGAIAGSSLGSGLMDMITGGNKSKSSVGKVGNKPFSESLDKYEKVVDKFSTFASKQPLPTPPSPTTPSSGGSGPLAGTPTVDTSKLTRVGVKEGGVPAYLAPSAANAFSQMKAAAAADGVDLRLSSAWRDSKLQAQLYQDYLAGKGPVAAPPGTSMHEKGLAIDVAGGKAKDWMYKNSARFGWRFQQIPGEDWHFNYWGGGGVTPSMYQQPAPKATPVPTPAPKPAAPRQISQYTSYSPSSYGEGQIIPLPISLEQQQQMRQSGGSAPMMIMGPSEQDLLNSFYKRVLLNTVA